MGFDDALIASEFEKLAQVFSAGAAKNCPPLPLTALVVQVLTPCSQISVKSYYMAVLHS